MFNGKHISSNAKGKKRTHSTDRKKKKRKNRDGIGGGGGNTIGNWQLNHGRSAPAGFSHFYMLTPALPLSLFPYNEERSIKDGKKKTRPFGCFLSSSRTIATHGSSINASAYIFSVQFFFFTSWKGGGDGSEYLKMYYIGGSYKQHFVQCQESRKAASFPSLLDVVKDDLYKK